MTHKSKKKAKKNLMLRNTYAEDHWNRTGNVYTGETQENKERPKK